MIYIDCRKIYNLFVRALETGREVSYWRAFLSCFAVSENEFYIYRQCTFVVLKCQSPERTGKLSKKSRNMRLSHLF
jgi:hypothetical protein